MIKKILIIIPILFFSYSTSAETIAYKLKSNLKIEGTSSIEVSATPLVDERVIEKSKEKLVTIINYANNQANTIKKKNKNRKPRTKFKGGPEEIFEKFANSVVYIENKKDRGTGSGFVVNHKGLKIITNWHVVETAKNVTICLKTEDLNKVCETDYYNGKVIKRNKQKDLAMIEVKGLPGNIKPVSYGKYKNVKIGQTAFAIGHPEGLVWTFTNGMISQKRPEHKWSYKTSRHKAKTIQIQVPINPGNSGGPLFNKDQKLIGVNTFTSEGENLNFAIAVDDLIEFINEVQQKDIDFKYIKKKKKGNTWIQKKSDKNKKSGISQKYPDAREIDINKNGIIDGWALDENKNGKFEKILIDENEDGIIEAIAYDENENQNIELILYDTDLDGNADEAEFDENDDGSMDVIAYDYNQDGEWDKFKNIS
ncbi:S1C family serine protease [Candidatus Pelagibacter bacterium nBUS_33]|uniref:S1C family serine protease n=1 Tax=Candidatus Pelagibacter bacterium nBUS_33 TaxID=3374193 RepID=UPI003EBAFEC2